MKTKMWHRVLAGVAFVVVAYGVWMLYNDDSPGESTAAPTADSTPDAPSGFEPEPAATRPVDPPEPTQDAGSGGQGGGTAFVYGGEDVATGGETWYVSHNYDGDTFVVDAGSFTEEVRMIGIDTPEIGECGYQEAQDYLRERIVGRTIEMVAGATTDRDDYDRLLRYAEADGSDVGLELIRYGLAHARYDSRSGKPHPREDVYREADAAYAHICD